MQKLRGIIAAPISPMYRNAEINYAKIQDLAHLYEKNGVDGVFICGTTGEGPSLTIDEKIESLLTWMSTKGQLKVVFCLGGNSKTDMQKLASKAAQAGVDGIAILAPYYFKPGSLETLVEFAAEIARAAPDTPFYFYHIPSMSGFEASMRAFLELAEAQIPTLSGIKFTHHDLYDFQLARAYKPEKFSLLFGRDEALLSALIFGADGGIGSTYNYATPLFKQIIKAFESNDVQTAKSLQFKAVEMVRILIKYGGTPATKAFMKIIGVDCGPCRLPLKELPAQQIIEMENDLKQIGFFEYCSKV